MSPAALPVYQMLPFASGCRPCGPEFGVGSANSLNCWVRRIEAADGARPLRGVPDRAVGRDGGIVRVRRLARGHPVVELDVDVVGDRRAGLHQRRKRDDQGARGKGFHAHNDLQMTRILVPVGFLMLRFLAGRVGLQGRALPQRDRRIRRADLPPLPSRQPRSTRPAARSRSTVFPPAFTPGQTYPITVTISRAGLRRGGFEIAARFAGGKQKGRQAGSWRLDDTRAQLIPGAVDKALTFVQHNQIGSRAATPGANSWTMEWTAPPAPAGVGAVQRRGERVEQRRLPARRLHLCEGGQERAREVGGHDRKKPRRTQRSQSNLSRRIRGLGGFFFVAG